MWNRFPIFAILICNDLAKSEFLFISEDETYVSKRVNQIERNTKSHDGRNKVNIIHNRYDPSERYVFISAFAAGPVLRR